MRRKRYVLGAFFLALLWGLNSCGTVQIVSEKKPVEEPIRPAKPAQEKLPPKAPPPPEASLKAPPPPEAPPEKSFLEKILQKVLPADTVSRTYPVEFASFHPQVNSALQDYARTRKGNSFQISRLGSDEVVLRGVYVREGTKERYSATLTVRPADSKRSRLEIKVAPATESSSPQNPEAAANEIFLIIEKPAGTRTP